jgi:site-specific DNA-methyltransferase (cytosine-N4-specific)
MSAHAAVRGLVQTDTTRSHARARFLPLATGSVQTVVTSPPYWGQRDYGDDPRELGGEDLHVYLDRLAACFDDVRRVLRSDGLVWVNIGDTAAGSGGAGGDFLQRGEKGRRNAPARRRPYRQGKATVLTGERDLFGEPVVEELAAGQWCDVPGRLVHLLQRRGWRLRANITWHKQTRNGKHQLRPEDLGHVNRPGLCSERILLLAPGPGRAKWYPERLVDRGDVWVFPTHTGRSQSQAPFPHELPRRCIEPCTDPGDVVLDVFAGSGATLHAAGELGRVPVGFDIDTPAVPAGEAVA